MQTADILYSSDCDFKVLASKALVIIPFICPFSFFLTDFSPAIRAKVFDFVYTDNAGVW